MRDWRELIKALTSSPRGWSADGRALGLGLATAMDRQRAQAARGTTVATEERLRHDADDRRVTTPV